MSTPHDPRTDRYEPLKRGLRASILVVVVLAVSAITFPGRTGEVAAAVMLTLLVVVPLVRIGWFVHRWLRRGDPRFALVGVGVLGVVLVGAALGALLA